MGQDSVVHLSRERTSREESSFELVKFDVLLRHLMCVRQAGGLVALTFPGRRGVGWEGGKQARCV